MKRKKAIIIFSALSALIIGILLIADSAGTADTIKRCIYVCLDSLIPSLFCFMVFSSILIKSGIGEILFTPLWYIMKFILHLDRKMFSIFLLSQIGGYPVGVKLLSELKDAGKEYSKEYNTALCYCYNSGPAFVVGIVGIGIYGDVKAGLIVFLSCVAANFTAAVITNVRNKPQSGVDIQFSLSVKDFSACLTDAAKALMNITLAILLFNATTELIGYIISNLTGYELPDIVKAIAEVTNIKNGVTVYSLPVVTALISFGGLCVIYQLYILAAFKINVVRFILTRSAIAIISALFCFIIVGISGYEPSIATFAYATDTVITDPLLLLCVAGMTFVLLKDTEKKI